MNSDNRLFGWSPRVWGAALVVALAFGWVASIAMNSSGQEGQPGGVETTTPEPAGPVPGQALPIPGPTDPLLTGGEVVSQERAAAIVGYPVVIPSDPLASESTLSEVWVQGDTDEVALRFSTGIRAYLAKWPTGKDPASSFAQQVKDAGAGWVDKVAAQPVWVLPKDAQSDGFPPQANVTIVWDGVEINIWGDVTTTELLRIASTLVD